MSYCEPCWISDYHFEKAANHRLSGDGRVILDGQPLTSNAANAGEMLVVWGSAHEGQLTLDPSFVVNGPAALPETNGPYRVEGLDVTGKKEFSLSFSPTPVEFGGGSFVFLVPYQDDWSDSLDRLVLTGPEGSYTLARNAAAPLAVVTDRFTGRIRAIIRDWDGGPLPGEGGPADRPIVGRTPLVVPQLRWPVTEPPQYLPGASFSGRPRSSG